MSNYYSEEEVRRILSFCDEMTMDECLKDMTPIQLPSDEELEKIAKEKHIGLSIDVQNYRRCFVQGAKWMRDKIGGQDE